LLHERKGCDRSPDVTTSPTPPSPTPPSPTPPSPTPPAGKRRIALGQAGEKLAAAWYAAQGYDVIERNWRSRIGEIDLICAQGNLLVFCEVKTRHTDLLGSPVEAVTRAKQVRLRRLAAEYLFLHTCGCHDVRFDVAAVLGSTGMLALTIIEDAF
jgi:putative endonuclease